MLIKKSKIPFKQLVTIGILPSFLKKMIYRLKGYKIGKNVSIGPGSVVIGKKVTIGDNVKIGLLTIIRGEEISIQRFVTIGSMTVIDSGKISIGEDARINEQVIIGGMKTPDSSIDLGKRTIVMEYAFINTTRPVVIGDDSGIGGHCLLFTHGSWLNEMDGFPVTFAPITIGKSVWLPWRVFIMPGVTLGDSVVVGANSLISKSVSSNTLVAGSPAKVIKDNYPPVISPEKRQELFAGYLRDFSAYLVHNGLKAGLEGPMGLSGANGAQPFEIRTMLQPGVVTESGIDAVVAMNITSDLQQLPATPPSKTMLIDLWRKERLGSSAVGEEFVKFLSRYGIRLARLD